MNMAKSGASMLHNLANLVAFPRSKLSSSPPLREDRSIKDVDNDL